MEMFVIFTLLIGLAFGKGYIVNIEQGELIGSILKSRDGREFYAFQGIPYAKPPIDDLRFEAPVPADPWKDVLNATKEPPMCLQKNLFMYKTYEKLLGDENCLYLNVYTPKIPQKSKKLLPVMVWIPGGGFTSGHGGLSLYGPHYLLDKDVVVVSINYRVGVFGFLSTEDGVLPGNYGMKDQVLALKWVKNNIDKFGGDEKKVTIFGESAGATSVGLHLLSPMSKGLFHKAILESGSSLCRWAVSPPDWAKRRALAVATITGCPEESKKLSECLKKVPANLLAAIHYNLFEWSIHPSITFMPVVEKNCNSKKESFLCKYPSDDFKEESNVPVLMGMNSGEGGLFAARMYDENGLIDINFEKYFEYYVSSLLLYKYTIKTADIPAIGKKISKRYFPGGKMDKPLGAVKMISGAIILQGVLGLATKLTSSVRFYVYDYQNEFSYNSVYGPYPYPRELGVTHGDEMLSLFLSDGLPELKGNDVKVSKLMVDLWTRFASNDKLIIDGKKKGKKWPKFKAKTMEYVLINSSNPVISQKPYVNEYEFWNDILPISSKLPKSEELTKIEL